MDNAIPYVEGGRSGQKARTRDALVAAAGRLVARGESPTIEAVAAAAGIGRGTAYRYFPNQRALLAAAHPEVDATSLLPPDAPDDPAERLRIVVGRIIEITTTTEPALRAMLRLSLDDGGPDHDLPLRKGRRIVWVADALAPLASTIGAERLEALSVAIAAVIGIEVWVWMGDVARVEPGRAAETVSWIAMALLDAAIGDDRRVPGPPV